ncbi:MAG: divergent PAP2 family protein [Erysipelotrichales bacterium]|nr:divergent PAP2 family protein [Erysipelotrichales bacterium]
MSGTRAVIEAAYPLCSALISLVLAQALKPFIYWFKEHKWIPLLAFSSGGLPSSHSAAVAGLTLAVGFQENFSSTLFAVSVIFSVIVVYDAANVRYYAGKNIEITQQLIKDLEELSEIHLDDPIYLEKVKNVLGHKWSEVISGIVLGLGIAILLKVFY